MTIRTSLNTSVSSVLEVIINRVVLLASCAGKFVRIEALFAEIVAIYASVVRVTTEIPNRRTASKTLSTIKVVIDYSCYVRTSWTVSGVSPTRSTGLVAFLTGVAQRLLVPASRTVHCTFSDQCIFIISFRRVVHTYSAFCAFRKSWSEA